MLVNAWWKVKTTNMVIRVYKDSGTYLPLTLNPILHGGGQIDPPPVDYRTLIVAECPKWADFW